MTDPETNRRYDHLHQKSLAFLRGIGSFPEIHTVLASAGFTDADNAQGWAFLQAASGYKPGKATVAQADNAVRNAMAELDGWDEPGFRRIRAALERLHPDQATFVFEGLEPAQGAAAVLSVSRLLDKLEKLRQGRSDQTREADQAAMATLEKRSITQQELARLRELVTIAQSAKMPEMPAVTTADEAARREQDMANLYAWYTDWSETARAVIQRRDYLIRLGLSKRRVKKEEEPAPDNNW